MLVSVLVRESCELRWKEEEGRPERRGGGGTAQSTQRTAHALSCLYVWN